MNADKNPPTVILEFLRQTPGCTIDDLVRGCPSLTWNQAFAEIDRLSRAGDIRLVATGRGAYRIEFSRGDLSRTPPPLQETQRAVESRTDLDPASPFREDAHEHATLS